MEGLKTTKEMCELMRVTKQTVIKYAHDGMPHIYVGNKFLFDPKECIEWVKTKKGRNK